MHLGVVGSDPAAPSNPGLKNVALAQQRLRRRRALGPGHVGLDPGDNSGVDIVLPQQEPLEPAYFSQPTKVAQ